MTDTLKIQDYVYEQKENFNIEMKTIKESNVNAKIKNIITEMKHFLVGYFSRMNKTEERIDELKNRSIKMAQTKAQKEELVKENKDQNGAFKGRGDATWGFWGIGKESGRKQTIRDS